METCWTSFRCYAHRLSKKKKKLDSKVNVKQKNARLVVKWFTQQENIDYNETFLPISFKDSLRITIALVTYYDLEFHQMDIKIIFLNGNLYENVYLKHLDGFVVKTKENLVCFRKISKILTSFDCIFYVLEK